MPTTQRRKESKSKMSISDSNVSRVARLALVSAALDGVGVTAVMLRVDRSSVTVQTDGEGFLAAGPLFGLSDSYDTGDGNVYADGEWQGIEVHLFAGADQLAAVTA